MENEAEFLEEYGFLQLHKDKYIANFIIDEPNIALLTIQNDMYKQAAKIYANDLYDELITSKVLSSAGIICNQENTDNNFLLWSLIPYIAACSGEEFMDSTITFDEVATIRPDGAKNIYHASVIPNDIVLPAEQTHMQNWCGPMWNMTEKHLIWQIDSEWSNRISPNERDVHEEHLHAIHLYNLAKEQPLSKYDCAWLAEHGYIKINHHTDTTYDVTWQIVILKSEEVKKALLTIGNKLKHKHRNEFNRLKETYIKASLELVPAHLKKIKEYEFQFLFHSDGYFLLHCILELLNNNKLKMPTEEQRQALTTILVLNN